MKGTIVHQNTFVIHVKRHFITKAGWQHMLNYTRVLAATENLTQSRQ